MFVSSGMIIVYNVQKFLTITSAPGVVSRDTLTDLCNPSYTRCILGLRKCPSCNNYVVLCNMLRMVSFYLNVCGRRTSTITLGIK